MRGVLEYTPDPLGKFLENLDYLGLHFARFHVVQRKREIEHRVVKRRIKSPRLSLLKIQHRAQK